MKLSFFFIAVILFISCDTRESDLAFKINFSCEFIDDNNIRFINESEGDYYSMFWDFGNGESVVTMDKMESFEIYYPEAGEYDVELKVRDNSGNEKTLVETINISNTDLLLSFSAEIDPSNLNYVNLENTTVGEFDSSIWIYRNKQLKNEINTKAYFPFKGTHEVELQIFKNNKSFPIKQSVEIVHDDPSYIDVLSLVWSDEFDGQVVSADNWTFETGSSGWGNNELQNYTAGNNAEIIDGKLIITARKVNDNTAVGSYTSSRMISRDKQEFTYGRMEIRAKLPSGTGIWPAIWMLGSNLSEVGWPACGELDIMEYVGYQPDIIHVNVHTNAGYGINGDGSSKVLESCEEEFHNYGLIWTENDLTFYIDTPDNITHVYNPTIKNTDNWPFNDPQFFILNIAIGGNWGGVEGVDNGIFAQTLEVDYVRVYQE